MSKYATEAMPMMGSDSKPKMRLDVSKISLVGDVSLNDEVEVVVKGRVTSIRGPEQSIGMDYPDKGKPKEVERTYPGELCVEISAVKVSTVGEFDGMDE